MKNLFVLIFFLVNFNFSYAQLISKDKAKNKDSIPTKITIYQANNLNLKINSHPVDTPLNDFQEYYPFYKNRFSDLYLGNYGLAYFDLSQKLSTPNNFIFFNQIKDYWYSPDSLEFYNTTKPYSQLVMLTGPKLDKENIVSFMHARNINPYWNVTVKFSALGALGDYNSQTTRGSSVFITTNYQKKNIRFFAYSLLNKLKNQENGGIVDTIDLIGTQIPVQMDNTYNQFSKKEYGEQFIYTMPFNIKREELVTNNGKDSLIERIEQKKLFSIGQSFKYSPQYKVYTDNEVPVNIYNGAFTYDSIASFDSINDSHLKANFFLKTGDELIPFFKIGAFVEYKLNQAKIYNFKEYVKLDNDTSYTDKSIRVGFFNQSGKDFNWQLDYELFTSGYHAGDYAANASINAKLLSEKFPILLKAKAKSSLSEPSFWYQNYFSNRISWSNNFDKIYLNEGDFAVKLPKISSELGLSVGNIQNYTFLNEAALPSQFSDNIQYLKANLKNIVDLKFIGIESKFLYQQYSDTSVIHLPQWTYSGSVYYKGYGFSHSMMKHIGFELFYNAPFKAPKYMPATGLFYLQNDSIYSNYPLVNFFFAGEIRRGRFFLKFINLNYLITKQKYFLVPKYPLPDAYFRFGFSWRFYD